MRDFNRELKDTSASKYVYNFDKMVMHRFIMRSFLPFFKTGSLLELGSNDGSFTKLLNKYFEDITCVEASDEALEMAKKLPLGKKVSFLNNTFETALLVRKFDNVVCTHVLEHVDDPILVLRKISSEWMHTRSRLLLVCPNANAASRQIAVKMRLIQNNSAVTEAEAAHGHKRTYSLNTLERDVCKSGLKVIHRSGIFFKALANFQWDRLLTTDIVSQGYLEGCFELGQQYPNLCASVFLVCEKE